MSPRRAPSDPPELRGFDYVKPLGAGGFSDVFLYQQRLPRRRVAVKVLLKGKVTAAAAKDFANEANLMAQLSTHPSIVSIYEADIAPDGRPYIVMEYCSKPNLQVRYRKGPFSVAEALRTGVRIAGAVETAHRAGILHRDIKPANILVNDYNRPVLTDFGIAGSIEDSEHAGMSVPWSPPEAFDDRTESSVRGDVFSLAATVYTLLASRSPFEIPGDRNTAAELMTRIQSSRLPPLGRLDVPVSLERVFEIGMAKDPASRHTSALEFARALQKVEIELNLPVTTVDVLDESIEEDAERDDDDGRTRVRGVVSIDPTGTSVGGTAATTGDRPFSTTDATILRDSTDAPSVSMKVPFTPPEVVSDETVVRDRVRAVEAADETRRKEGRTAIGTTGDDQGTAPPGTEPDRRSWVRLVVGIGVSVLVVGGIVTATLVSGTPSPSPTETFTSPPPPPSSNVPPVENVVATLDGDQVVVTWENPDPEPGDYYLWGVQVAGEARDLDVVHEETVTIPAEGNEDACIEVTLVRVDGRAAGEVGVGCVS